MNNMFGIESSRSTVRNPFGVDVIGENCSQGSRCAATLGYPIQALRAIPGG